MINRNSVSLCLLLCLQLLAWVRVQGAGEDILVADKTPIMLSKQILTELDRKLYNIADDVSEDYPAIFNIILFIAISLILALIAICVAIATMDPGRDSLIYRVTSAQRYKKDN